MVEERNGIRFSGASRVSDDELFPVTALQQQPCVLGPARTESGAQHTKPLVSRVKEAMGSQQQQQLSNVSVVQFSGAGFSFSSLVDSQPLSDIASNWDDALFEQEDMEALFGLDGEKDALFPAFSPSRLNTSAPASRLPVQPVDSTFTSSSAHTSQLVSLNDSGGNTNVDAVLPAANKAQIAKNPSAGVPAITGRKRLKRQDEIALLREEAPKLQAQLDMLREFWRQESIRVVQRSNRESRDTKSAEPEWKTIAAQGRDEVAVSVKQNEWLKAQFQQQKKALQHIRKLIRKRVVSARKLQRQLDGLFQLDPQQIRIGSASVFQFLLADSNAMFQSFEEVHAAVSLRKPEDDEHRDWGLQRKPEIGTFVEMINRYVVPFDKSLVVKALRNLYETPQVEERVCEFLSSSEDMIMTQFIAGFAHSNGSGRVRTRYAARFSEQETTESTRCLVTGLIDRLTATGESRDLAQLREQTWTLITSCKSSTSRRPLTVIQTYYTMAPEVTQEFHLDNIWDTKIIQQVLIPTLDLSMDKLQRGIESELVNLSTKFRRLNVRIEPVTEL